MPRIISLSFVLLFVFSTFSSFAGNENSKDLKYKILDFYPEKFENYVKISKVDLAGTKDLTAKEFLAAAKSKTLKLNKKLSENKVYLLGDTGKVLIIKDSQPNKIVYPFGGGSHE